MADQQIVEDLKEQLATQARTFEERLPAIEASRDAGGLQEASAVAPWNHEEINSIKNLLFSSLVVA